MLEQLPMECPKNEAKGSRLFLRLAQLAGLILAAVIFSGCGMFKKTKTNPVETDNSHSFAVAYSKILGIEVPQNCNRALVEHAAQWLEVPYKFGGTTRSGVDCSGLISNIYPVVFGKQVPRTTAALQLQATPVPLTQLKQGDLVFFTISASRADHAGIFLWDHYFLHASTSRGVIISSLQEAYWKKYLAGAGRF